MSFDSGVISESFEKAKPILADVVLKSIEFMSQYYSDSLQGFEDQELVQYRERLVEFIPVFVEGSIAKKGKNFCREKFQQYKLPFPSIDFYIQSSQSFLRSLEYFFGDDWEGELSSNWQKFADFLREYFEKDEGKIMDDFKKIPNHTVLRGAPTILPTGEISPTFKPAEAENAEANKFKSLTVPPTIPTFSDDPPDFKLEEIDSVEEKKLKPLTVPPTIPTFSVEAEVKEEHVSEIEVNKSTKLEQIQKESEIKMNTTMANSVLEDSKNSLKVDENLHEIKIEGIGTLKFDSVKLPDQILNSIQKAAEDIVKKSIQKELEQALENEFKKYMEKGIGDFLKKTS